MSVAAVLLLQQKVKDLESLRKAEQIRKQCELVVGGREAVRPGQGEADTLRQHRGFVGRVERLRGGTEVVGAVPRRRKLCSSIRNRR